MKLLASDYDGTLNYGTISERNREAIKRFRAAGNLFGVVSGRDYFMYDTLRDQGLPVDFVLAFNGGMAIDANGEILYEERIVNSGVFRGIAMLTGERYHTFLSCVDTKTRYTAHGENPDRDAREAELAVTDALPSFTMMNTCCKTEDEAAQCTADINREFGNVVAATQNGYCIDIPPVGVDKGTGVARYARLLGIAEDDIYCAGDNMNDLPMITRFHGCAVQNARPEVKAAAERTYADIAEIIDTIMRNG